MKTRVKLLEEGQTKDLTILVGQKVDEGASSEEVRGKDKIKANNFIPLLNNLRRFQNFKSS